MIGIYKITNKQNGKIYIGQATDIERRLNEHKQTRSQRIDNYINVLGVDNFDFEVLEECSLSELDEKEQFYIEKYDSRKNGYNINIGGFNNSSGEGNGRAKLTEDIVIKMRKAYANHSSPKDFFESIKYTGISKSAFQSAWQGYSWSHVMPEVFTEENKQFYIREYQRKKLSIFSAEEVLRYRKYYVSHTAEEVYNLVIEEKGKEFTSLGTVKKMLCGDGKEKNFYSRVPIYDKRQKIWKMNGKPVTTISESGE